MKDKRANDKYKLCALLGLTLLCFLGAFFSFSSWKIADMNPVLVRPMTVLVAGADQEYDESTYSYKVKVKDSFLGRTDTIMIFQFDPALGRLTALSIPRDTRIYINGRRPEKINALNTIGGPLLLKKVLEDLLDIKIDRYVLVNTKSVEKAIDSIGGVEVDVPRDMKYSDKTDGINIDLKKGKQILNGNQTVGFLRFRKTATADIGRIERQQLFLRALRKKLSEPTVLARGPVVMSKVMDCIKTDLSMIELLRLGYFAKGVTDDKQEFETLAGEFNEPGQPIAQVVKKTTEEPAESEQASNPPAENPENGGEKETETENVEVIYVTPLFVSYWIPHPKEIREQVNRLFKLTS